MGDLAKKARDGKLGPADMRAAASRSARWAASAARYFTPIINAPEVAILGVSKSFHEAGVGRQEVRAAPDPAAVAVVRPPRHRRCGRGALQRLLGQLLAD
jgi:pyruvate/2-oxoglutarate dehydrogenase complex dihydrolipoamide acyltransferase (E2) component